MNQRNKLKRNAANHLKTIDKQMKIAYNSLADRRLRYGTELLRVKLREPDLLIVITGGEMAYA